VGRAALECSDDSGDDVAMTAQHGAVRNGLEHVEDSLETATFRQAIVGMDLRVESSGEWFQRLEAAQVGTGQETCAGARTDEREKTFAQ